MQQQPQQQRPSDSTDPSKQPDWKLAEALTALDELEAVIDEFAAQRAYSPFKPQSAQDIVAAEVKAAALLASVEQSLSASLLTSLPTSMSSLPRLPGAPPAAPVMSPMQIITHASTKDLRDAVRAGDANALNIHNRVITAITQAANSLR